MSRYSLRVGGQGFVEKGKEKKLIKKKKIREREIGIKLGEKVPANVLEVSQKENSDDRGGESLSLSLILSVSHSKLSFPSSAPFRITFSLSST